MDDIEKIRSRPVGTPWAVPTKSYWQMERAEIANEQTYNLPEHSIDIIIVGSGISGASIAYNLLTENPNLTILMLEARQAASGASGRNGGHTKGGSYRKFKDDIQASGVEDAVKIAKLEYDCMKAVHEFIKTNSIDCDAKQCDTVDVYYDKDQFEQAHDLVASMKEHIGADSPVTRYDFFDTNETASKFLTPNSFGSIRYEAGRLNAYKFTIGVLKLALSKGLYLKTNSTVQSIERWGEDWMVKSERGNYIAPKVILATNGYTAGLLPSLQGTIVPFRGIVTAQYQGLGMPKKGLDHTYSFVYKNGYDYMISRPATNLEDDANDDTVSDSVIVIGGGLTKAKGDGMGEFGITNDMNVDKDIETYLYASTANFFGKNWGEDYSGRTIQCWSGIMGYSADGYPLVGQVPGQDGLWIDASFQGHGMVLCFLCAKAVSQMIVGRDGPELKAWFPECFRVSEERMSKKFQGMHIVPDVAEGAPEIHKAS